MSISLQTAFLKACRSGRSRSIGIVKLLLDHPDLIHVDMKRAMRLSENYEDVLSLLSNHTKNTEDTETTIDYDDILYSLRNIL